MTMSSKTGFGLVLKILSHIAMFCINKASEQIVNLSAGIMRSLLQHFDVVSGCIFILETCEVEMQMKTKIFI